MSPMQQRISQQFEIQVYNINSIYFKSFNFVYRIHIQASHDGVEPKENHSEEHLLANTEDYICLICIKKYKGKQALKSHLIRQHLGANDETKESDAVNEFEKSKDPLNCDVVEVNGNSENSSDNSQADTSIELIKEVNIEDIKNSADDIGDNSKIAENEKPVKNKIQALLEKEQLLLTQMFNSLKKFGCAFCKER